MTEEMTNNEGELKPCLFEGDGKDHKITIYPEPRLDVDGEFFYQIFCSCDWFYVDAETKEEAIRIWNARHRPLEDAILKFEASFYLLASRKVIDYVTKKHRRIMRAVRKKTAEEILEKIGFYWRFDEEQQHTHTWRDLQGCVDRIKEEYGL